MAKTVTRKAFFIGLSLIAIFALSFGLILFTTTQPTKHFNPAQLPVIALPDSENLENNNSTQTSNQLGQFSGNFNILLLGTDSWSTTPSRADLIMVVNVNPKTGQVNILSIPRDTKVEVKGVGATKINHTHILGEITGGSLGGSEATIAAVSDLLGCPINYYAKINFRGFEDFIDEIDGLDITLKQPVKLTFKGSTLPKGEQHVDGETALEFVRERFSLSDGDFARQRNQVLVLKAFAHKLLNPQYISKLPQLLKQINTNLETNLTESDLLSLARLLKETDETKIVYYQLPGNSDYSLDPLTNTKLYYWVVDSAKTWEIAENYFNGSK